MIVVSLALALTHVPVDRDAPTDDRDDRLGDQGEEAHEAVVGPTGLPQAGEVAPELLPLGLVPAVVAPGDGMTCWLGELTTAPRGRLARSHVGLAVAYSSRGIPNDIPVPGLYGPSGDE
jgi:hypothetical protein